MCETLAAEWQNFHPYSNPLRGSRLHKNQGRRRPGFVAGHVDERRKVNQFEAASVPLAANAFSPCQQELQQDSFVVCSFGHPGRPLTEILPPFAIYRIGQFIHITNIQHCRTQPVRREHSLAFSTSGIVNQSTPCLKLVNSVPADLKILHT